MSRKVERAFAEIGRKAVEAQDAQIVLSNPLRRIADKADLRAAMSARPCV